MINNQTAGKVAKITVPLVDANDAVVTASAVAWKLLDEDGASLATGTATVGSGEARVTLSEAETAITDGVSSAGRELVLTCTTTDGEVEIRDYFVLVNAQPLVRYGNTIVTYPEALALRQSFGPTLDGWDGAETQPRIQALIHAHANLSRLCFVVSQVAAGNEARDYAAYGTGEDLIWDFSRKVFLNSMTPEKFAPLPGSFKQALKRAQLIEADVILGGDAVSKTRQDGIISESIGESSTFYNSKPFLNLPVSRRTYEVLKPYIRFRVGVSR